MEVINTIINDPEYLQTTLCAAENHKALKGDFVRLSKLIAGKIEQANTEQIESFRELAESSLSISSPNDTLADNTAQSDFRFRHIKAQKIGILRHLWSRISTGKTAPKPIQKAIYIIADSTRIDDYALQVGLITLLALTEMIRVGRKGRVVFLCDEATNFKINNLPSLLTLAREYNIVLWIIL